MSKELLFTIHGLDIKSDTVYQITPKPDLDAPEAFQKHGTSKVLNTAVDDSVPGAIFDASKNAWDTGLYLESKALNKAFPVDSERKAAIKNIEKYIIKPIEKLKGEGTLSHLSANNAFWDDYRIKLKKDAVFYTNKPEDLLNLFLAVIHRQLTPSVISTGNHEFDKSQYCVQDKDSVVDREQQLEMEQMNATGTFYNMLKNKKQDIAILLDYMGRPVSENSDEAAMISIFNKLIKDKKEGIQNTQTFLRLVDKISKDAGETELYIYSKLKNLHSKDRIKQRKGHIWYEDQLLGVSFKDAAENIMKDKNLQKEILELE